jgi:hypothetical protein
LIVIVAYIKIEKEFNAASEGFFNEVVKTKIFKTSNKKIFICFGCFNFKLRILNKSILEVISTRFIDIR